MSHTPLTALAGKRSLSRPLIKRRALLKGLGSASFLAAPVFRATLAEAQAAPVRLIVLSFPGGAWMQAQGPAMSGPAQGIFSYDKMLSPLASLSSDLLLVENLIDPNGSADFEIGHDGERVMLTGDARGLQMDVGGFTPPGMTSVDQTIAQSIGKSTQYASLQFGVFTDFPAKGDDDGSIGRIIYANGVAVPPVQDPATMFSRLFSGTPGAPPGSAPTDPAALAKLKALTAQRQSILDLLKAQVTDIQGLVGSAEKQRLDEHLNSLRELEKSIMSASGGGTGGGLIAAPGVSCAAPSLGAGTDLPAVSATMSELLYQSINCDATRVASLQWLCSGNSVYFTWLGLNSLGHHAMQHAPGPDLVAAQTWLMAQVAVVIQRLNATPEGSGSMLDNCLVLLSSEMGDGNYHTNHPVPVLIAGKAGGQLTTGRTVNGNGRPRANLLLNIGNLMGVPLSTYGDPAWVTGPVNLG